jgi:hypothetical protein
MGQLYKKSMYLLVLSDDLGKGKKIEITFFIKYFFIKINIFENLFKTTFKTS